jgi:transcription elongation factor Elf1
MAEETYESEGPKCPHCGRQYTADEPHYFDEMSFTEMDCDQCGEHFEVEVHTTTNWLCTVSEE